MAGRIITRTFVENPDANKDVYRTEDHLRDLEYNESKIKYLTELVFTKYPGWISYPTITFDTEDPRLINISTFKAIDRDGNVIISDGMTGISIPDYQLNIPYYAIIKAVMLPTADRRKNEERANILYQYVLQEEYIVEFVNHLPENELCLGRFVYQYDAENEITYGSYQAIGRTEQLPSLTGIIQILMDYVNSSDEKFLIAKPTSEGGDVAYSLETPIDIPAGRTKPVVLGVNPDGKIGPGVIPWGDLSSRLQQVITIPGRRIGIENNYVEIETDNRNQLMKIRNLSKSIHGEIAFDTGPEYGGAAVAIITSENVFTQDYVDMELADDTIYITGTNTTQVEGDGGGPVVRVKIRNNFWDDVQLQVEFIR